MTADVKLFFINDSQWIAARSEDEARAFWEDEDCDDLESIVEVPDDDLDKLTLFYPDAEADEPDRVSFREALEVFVEQPERLPSFFASEDY